jgi:hypothetical protein
MFEDVAIFIIILTGMALVAWLLHTLIHNRHQTRLERANGLGAVREVELLSSENAGLKGQVGRLEERIATLERIATDPAERTAREIERLR